MSDISDCIIKILADNGVSVEQKELWGFAGKAENVIQLDFSEHDKRLIDEIMQLKQRIAELESKETKSFGEVPGNITIDGYKCKIIKTESGLYISRDEIYSIIEKEKEPLKQKCKELEDKHQSDCIEINRLNTTIDVLIHKVEYLRQFAGLE